MATNIDYPTMTKQKDNFFQKTPNESRDESKKEIRTKGMFDVPTSIDEGNEEKNLEDFKMCPKRFVFWKELHADKKKKKSYMKLKKFREVSNISTKSLDRHHEIVSFKIE